MSIHFLGRELTFKEVYESALKFAAYLKELGLEKGDRVAISLPNCPQSVISYFGILIAGGIVVSTNPTYTERELEYQMKDSGSKMMVTTGYFISTCRKNHPKYRYSTYYCNRNQRLFTFPKKPCIPFYSKETVWNCR